jgi:CDP-diacylglycerol--glycerol-3-phosphate 3-phosphatidyltransferase
MNLPNKLTVFRVLLVPVLIIVGYVGAYASAGSLFLGIPVYMWIMNLIFIIASITDKLDGSIARKRNLVTNFGKFLDPIADKILVIAAMILFVGIGRLPAWIPIIVIFREFIVSGFRLVAVEAGGKVIAASVWGKLKTVTQMIALIFAFIDVGSFFQFVNGSLGGYQLVINIISSVMLAISVVATIFSGWDYLKNGKDLLKDM